MRLITILLSGMLICLGISCVAAQKTTHSSENYKVIYKLPVITSEMQNSRSRMLDEPVYAMDGKAVAFELSTGQISVVANGKKRDFSLPTEVKPLGYPSAVIRGSKLYYNIFDEEKLAFSLGQVDLNTGKRNTVNLNESVDLTPITGFVSPNGKLSADDSKKIRVLDIANGKELPVPKMSGYIQLLGWNKASDGLYLLHFGEHNSTELLLWKLAASKPIKIAVLKDDVDPDYTSLSLSAGKLAWFDRSCLFVTDLASGKTTNIAHVDGYASKPQMSPSGRYLLTNYALPKNQGKGFRIYCLSNGMAYTRICNLKYPEIMPFTWHPTQDKLLAVYAHSMTNVEIREYTAIGLIAWIAKRNLTIRADKTYRKLAGQKKK